MVLDAACGISHPLKFYLAGFSDEVYACDLDARILSREAILQNIADDIGAEAARQAGARRTTSLHLAQADLTKLPYADESFDTIFASRYWSICRWRILCVRCRSSTER